MIFSKNRHIESSGISKSKREASYGPLPFPGPPTPHLALHDIWLYLLDMRILGAINAHGKFWKIDLNDQRDTSHIQEVMIHQSDFYKGNAYSISFHK